MSGPVLSRRGHVGLGRSTVGVTAARPATVMVTVTCWEWRTATVTGASDSATVTRTSCSLAPLPVTVSGTEPEASPGPGPGAAAGRRGWLSRLGGCHGAGSFSHSSDVIILKRVTVHAYRHGLHQVEAVQVMPHCLNDSQTQDIGPCIIHNKKSNQR